MSHEAFVVVAILHLEIRSFQFRCLGCQHDAIDEQVVERHVPVNLQGVCSGCIDSAAFLVAALVNLQEFVGERTDLLTESVETTGANDRHVGKRLYSLVAKVLVPLLNARLVVFLQCALGILVAARKLVGEHRIVATPSGH